ncbi:MAG TPA: NAD+ synthase [Chitinophagales bacterium]|nr:NAD+ synthase [Chitinophagales bacterium]
MKIAVAQNNYHIGNFESNFKKIKDSIHRARSGKCDLVIFSELAVCGYPPRDFLEFSDFISRCEEVIQKIAAESKDIAVIVGSPSRNPRVEGKDLFNSAYYIENGEVKQVVHKALLPTYDVFDEYRYFEPNRNFQVVNWKGKKIATSVCEDIWNVGNENPLYTICPIDELMAQNPDFIVNISASPFDYEQTDSRLRVLRANCLRYKLPLLYVNHVGAQTELIFDGGSMVMNAAGNVYDVLPYFEEAYREYDLTDLLGSSKKQEEDKAIILPKIQKIHDALVLGIRDYFQKLGFEKAILGLSGGIDSAVVLVLAARALGTGNVLSVLMPSEFSSPHSVTDAVELCQRLEARYDTVSISSIYHSCLETLKPVFAGTPFNVAEENLQARIRANILMAYANKRKYILLNTSNKSETAVGYGTLYGDMCGGLSVLGDVYKTEVYELAQYINKDKEIIPKSILDKPPSAELRPNQKDTDSLPEYAVLDKVLYQYIEKRQGPKELVKMGFEKSLVDRVLKMVNTNEFKRHQTPPILRVSPKAFGMGRRMPIVGKYLS